MVCSQNAVACPGHQYLARKYPLLSLSLFFGQGFDASWQNINLFKALPSLDLIVDDEGEYEGDHGDKSGHSQPWPPVQLMLVGTCKCLFVPFVFRNVEP